MGDAGQIAMSNQLLTGRRGGLALVAAGLAFLTGCYDDEALLKKARSAALKTRLAEVELGAFQTTLPRDEKTNLFTDLDLKIFGTVPRYRLTAVKKLLKLEQYRLRYETLAALRQSTREELAEPNLAQLRGRLEKIINGVLAESPVTDIGFSQLTLRHR